MIICVKICRKCNLIKPLEYYNKHPKTLDGYRGECRDCANEMTKTYRANKAKEDAEWREKVKTGNRHRSRKRKGIKRTPEQSKERRIRHKNETPEKYMANTAAQSLPKINGFEKHHWSYNKEHHKDIIYLSIKDHAKAHRFIFYDKEQKMFRRNDTKELLINRDIHESYVRYCISYMPD